MKNKPMTCKKCKGRIVLPAFSTGTCESCGAEIVSTNTPPDRLCPKCALIEARCEHCGEKLDIPVVLLSLQPRWWKLIASGEKTLELRKTTPKIKGEFFVLVYVTAPVSKIMGMFRCPDVLGPFTAGTLFSSPDHKVPAEEMANYAAGKRLYCWKICDVQKFDESSGIAPISLGEIGLSHPPQSWCYYHGKQAKGD